MTGGIDDYDRPLRAYKVPGHATEHRQIDSFYAQFDQFRAVFDDADSLRTKGHLFVVAGDRGYGKTALRQWCACWMVSDYSRSHGDCKPVVVDLSDEVWENESFEIRLARIRNLILDEVSEYFTRDVADIKNDADMVTSFHALGRRLRTHNAEQGKAQPIILIVLLPGYPPVAELAGYYRLARTGMVFMAEIFDPKEEEEITDSIENRRDGFSRDDIEAHVLSLGELKPGDDLLLMEWIQGGVKGCPAFSDKEVTDYFEGLIRDKKVSVSRFVKLLIGALRAAAADQANTVSKNHIMSYYDSQNYEPRDRGR